jgi:hypothetical protein
MRWILACMLVLGAAAQADEPWVTRSEADGVRLETRPVAGSAFETVRVSCGTSASPRAFIKALWGVASDTSTSPEVKRREVLVDEAQERRYYDVVHPPPASDRDYVMHERWAEDEATGNITMRFVTVSDERKPVTSAYVRFGKVEGEVSAQKRPTGGSELTYVVFMDLGGSMPAWLTRGAQRDAAKKFLLEIRRRAEQGPTP